MNPSTRLSSLLAASLVMGVPLASAQEMYKCVDEHGNVTFANTGNMKGCTRLNVEPVVIPKFVAPGKSAAGTASASGSAAFPKVDTVTQKARDSDRRRILEDELRDKQSRLADLRREYNNGEPERQGNERNYQRYLDRVEQLKGDIARTETDISSIKAEIDRIQ